MYWFWISHKNIGSSFIEKYPKTIATKIKSNGFTVYGAQLFYDDCSKRLLTLSTKNKLRMKTKTPTARVTYRNAVILTPLPIRLVCVCLYEFNIIDIILIHHSSRSSSNLIVTLGIDNQKIHCQKSCITAGNVSVQFIIKYGNTFLKRNFTGDRLFSIEIIHRLLFVHHTKLHEARVMIFIEIISNLDLNF